MKTLLKILNQNLSAGNRILSAGRQHLAPDDDTATKSIANGRIKNPQHEEVEIQTIVMEFMTSRLARSTLDSRLSRRWEGMKEDDANDRPTDGRDWTGCSAMDAAGASSRLEWNVSDSATKSEGLQRPRC